MWYFTEIADWWERNRKETDVILDQWVENSSYNSGVMLVASTTKAFTAFGAGFVDILRLGDGAKKGTLKGFGIDALRVVAIFPFGKTAKTVKSFQGLSRAKVLVDTGGPNCFWIASAKAFSQIGHKYKGRLFATVEDVANALGMRMPGLWEIPNLTKGISYLQRIGAKTGAIKKVTSTKEMISRIPHDGSVLMIVVDVMKDSKIIGGHAIYMLTGPCLVKFVSWIGLSERLTRMHIKALRKLLLAIRGLQILYLMKQRLSIMYSLNR